jgi:hypothetical protein
MIPDVKMGIDDRKIGHVVPPQQLALNPTGCAGYYNALGEPKTLEINKLNFRECISERGIEAIEIGK